MGQRQCPWCHAYLDPGEICDCKKEVASSDANTESDKGNISTENVTDFGGKVNDKH